MRIGFLCHHDAAHQMPQAAPFAFERSRIRPGLDVIIAWSGHADVPRKQEDAATCTCHQDEGSTAAMLGARALFECRIGERITAADGQPATRSVETAAL